VRYGEPAGGGYQDPGGQQRDLGHQEPGHGQEVLYMIGKQFSLLQSSQADFMSLDEGTGFWKKSDTFTQK
jgi:hypothetical protein